MLGRVRRSSQGQTATEYMLIISVVVIAVVAAAYNFVPLFEEGVKDLGQDVKQMLSNGGGRGGGGGGGMGAGPSARVASRPCDGSAEALRYEAMIAPPPCAATKPKPWTPAIDVAPLPLHAPESLGPALCHDDHGAQASLPAEPEPAACREEPLVYLSSARLGRRSRSRNR